MPLLMAGEGTQPREKASDYPAHVWAGRAEIGAEYLSRTISTGKESYFTGPYLVFEVALYPDKGVTLPVSPGDFQLRVNGHKVPLLAQTPGMVAMAVRNPEWEDPGREVVAGVGTPDGRGIYVGGNRQLPRFPGDRAPVPNGQTKEAKPVNDPGEAAIQQALPELKAQGPVSGLIYFAYHSKQNKIRGLELIYEGPAGRRVLRLR